MAGIWRSETTHPLMTRLFGVFLVLGILSCDAMGTDAEEWPTLGKGVGPRRCFSGTFHFGITPEKLMEPHESKPWNPIIANVFYRAGIIERWGSGTLNIIDWCSENGNPPPTWMEQAGSIFVSFIPAIIETGPEVTDQAGTKPGPSRDRSYPRSQKNA